MALKERNNKEKEYEVELVVSVDGEVFEKAIEAAYKRQVKKINVQGFRKGKAPRRIIEKLYGAEVFYDDAMQDCYPDALYEAAEEAGVKIVAVETLEAIEAGKDGFTFKAQVVTEPTMDINNYKGIEVEKKSTEVTEELIEKEIEQVRERNSRLVTVDRASENGDTAVIDFEGFVDGVAFEGGKAEGYNLSLGSGNFIPGFEEQIVGHTAGEEFSINVQFPENYASEELKGKAAEFKIVLHEIKTKELPEVDDEFVQDVSDKETLDEYKEELRETVGKRLKDEAEKDVDDQISAKLIELLEGEIPQVMFDKQADEMIKDFEMRLRSQGLDMNTYMQYMGMDVNALRGMYKEDAEKRVKLRLALETIAKKENIEVTEADLDEEYGKIAETYKMDVEKVKESVPADSLSEDVKVQKALNLVKDNANIK